MAMSLWSYIFGPPCTQILSQRSYGSRDKVATNGRTDTTDFITFLANAAGKNAGYLQRRCDIQESCRQW